jgi:hypothetical protein
MRVSRSWVILLGKFNQIIPTILIVFWWMSQCTFRGTMTRELEFRPFR